MPKLYKTIIADPPWEYHTCGITKEHGQALNHYETMCHKQIAALPISKIAHPDSALLLWATWPKLIEGLEIINGWGFSYVTGFPWLKIKDISKDLWGRLTIRVRYGIGFWFRGCSEMVLIGKRGNSAPSYSDFVGLLCPSVVHSKKPKNLYEYAESLPGPYLELFARNNREGWDSWGNEIDSVDLPELTAFLDNTPLNPTKPKGRFAG